MKNMRAEARKLIEMLRSNAPDEREKAAVLIYEQGMLAQKYIMQAAKAGQPDQEKPRGGNDKTAA